MNFRDIGGLPTIDGRRVCRGRVYRSHAPDWFDAERLATVSRMPLRTVIDLRSGEERRAGTSPLAHPGLTRWQLPLSSTIGAPHALLHECMAEPGSARRQMEGVYRAIPFDHVPGFTAFMAALAEGETPLLLHCSAGKDRTGVAMAILLTLLGVERDVIVKDYLRTNAGMSLIRSIFLSTVKDEPDLLDAEQSWHPMIVADAAYLDAMFEEVVWRCGSVELYARHHLDVSPEALAAIEHTMLR
jgi:protein-tyrosine phosphatase